MSGSSIAGAGPSRTKLVGFGLLMVALGWLALVADLVVAATGLQAGGLVALLSLKADVATLSELLVVTGLGLAIVGALRDGFGMLSRFFDAALLRSAAARPVAAPEAVPDGIGAVRHERPAPSAAPGRNYRLLPDGSVEVDTLLGTRVFASMEEARDFIR